MPEMSKKAERDIEALPPALRLKAEALIARLDAELALGKKLQGKLRGKRSVWLGRTHRIVYTVSPATIVLTIIPRRDAYR